MKSVILLVCFLLVQGLASAQSVSFSDQPSSEIRNLLESRAPGKAFSIGEEELGEYDLLLKLYSDREFKPLWIKNGKLVASARDLLEQIEASKYDGLMPEGYHLKAIREAIAIFGNAYEDQHAVHHAYIDLVLSDAYLRLAKDLYLGKVSQEGLQKAWGITPKRVKVKFGEELIKAVEEQKVKESLVSFWPRYQVYRSMRKSIQKYYAMREKLDIPWEELGGKTIKVNQKNESVPAIRKRLYYWNDLSAYSITEEALFDSVMQEGVKRFQQRNGLEADGIIGKDTYSVLNESPGALIKKVAVNMERLRWLPDTVIRDRFVMVNIANFQLDYLQDNGLDTVFTSRVIVGKEYHTTPVFNGEMTYIVLSPTWTVPSSIIRGEMIPKIKKDINYLNNNHLKILTYAGKEVSPGSIDWSTVSSKNFSYMIRQSPGPSNSLGQAKFIFPNKYNVYIHDTPVKSLFSKDVRAFSHGCIRVQNPAELAEILLEEDKKWDKGKIKAAMDSGKETTVMLKKKVPVVLIYLTFWTDPAGNDYLRKDIYKRDEAIVKALFEE